MKLAVKREQLNETPDNFLRRAGWGLIHDRRRNVSSFVKRLGDGFYPRLHLYYDESGDQVIFNMHLDQKQASYEGSHMHNAEYDGEVVAVEIEKLRSLVGQANNSRTEAVNSANVTSIKRPGYSRADFEADIAEIKASRPKSWWRRLFDR
jgi:hypothetical protein